MALGIRSQSTTGQIVRPQCRQCKKHYLKQDLLLGVCGRCWEERVSETTTLAELNTYQHRCFDCNKPLLVGRYQYDPQAKSFSLLCLDCSERKIRITVPHTSWR